jgi:hypothetical protein
MFIIVTEREDDESDLAYDALLINIYRSSWGHAASIFRTSDDPPKNVQSSSVNCDTLRSGSQCAI